MTGRRALAVIGRRPSRRSFGRICAGLIGAGLVARIAPARADATDLIEATKRSDLQAVEALLAAGAEPDGHDRNNNTALIFAARDGFTAIARRLIAAGATVNWIDGEGVTPLILASFKNHTDVVSLLLDHGADATIRDQWDRKALDYALRRGENDPIALMIQGRD